MSRKPSRPLHRVMTITLVAVMTTTIVGVGAPAGAATRCGGKRATIVGTNGANTINGTRGNDVIAAKGGVDRIDGKGGNDIICAGGGGDFIFGGPGNDRILAQGGDDIMTGDGGDDLLAGGPGTLDILFYGNSPRPVDINLVSGIVTGDGRDRVTGQEAAFGSIFGDNITGDGANNTLFGGDGADTIRSGAGIDGLDGGGGNDTLDGGPDLDLAFYNSSETPVDANIGNGTVTSQSTGNDSIANIDVIVGSNQNDVLTGSDGVDFFLPQAGDDQIHAGGGFDMIMYFDSPSAITADIGRGTASGPQNAQGDSPGSDTFDGIEGLFGSGFDDNLTGGPGNDFLAGDIGNDMLNGGGGDDWLSGGTGGDDIDGGVGRDVADFSFAPSGVHLDLTAGVATGEGNDTIRGVEDAVGSSFDDVFGGSNGSNNFWGWEGADTLQGFAGDDAIDGGTGVDQVDGGDGTDQCGDDPTDQTVACEGVGLPADHPLAVGARQAVEFRRNH